MMRFLTRVVIFLVTAVLALWITSLLVDGFDVTWEGIVIAAAIFAVLQALLAPFIVNMARKYASFLLGGVGLVSTFLALWITTLIADALSISGVSAWVVGTLVVWIVTAVGGWALGLIFLKERAATKAE